MITPTFLHPPAVVFHTATSAAEYYILQCKKITFDLEKSSEHESSL